MTVRFLEVARAEYRDAVDYYDTEKPGLGREFSEAVESALQQITNFPNGWPQISAHTRRCPTKRFPYGLIYQQRDDLILVVAIMHLKREPTYWRTRI